MIKVKGSAIWAALENGVCLVPALEGRFPQVAGMKYSFDPQKESGNRILWVEIGDKPLDPTKEYVLATRGYMGRGKDGFDSLLVKSEGGEAEEIVSEENGILISMILRQYFMSLKILGKWRRWGTSMNKHWAGIHEDMHPGGEKIMESPAAADNATGVPNHDRNGSTKHRHHNQHKTEVNGHLVDSDTDDEEHHTTTMTNAENIAETERHIMRTVTRKWMRLAGIERREVGMVDDHEDDSLPQWTRGIAPR